MATALGKTISGIKNAYKQGDRDSVGLGKELNERMKMNKIGNDARLGGAAVVEPPKASPLGPSMKVDRVNPNYKPTAIPKELQPLPKLKKGTPKVTKGGLAMLHKGESVLTKEETSQLHDRGAVALSGSDKPKAKAKVKAKGPKMMTIKRLDDNSFNVRHHADETMGQDKEVSARNPKHLARHIKQTFGGAGEPDMPEAQAPVSGGAV